MRETNFKMTEVGEIPKDWEVKKLGEIGSLSMCKRVFQEQTSLQGDVPFYKIGTFGKEADAYISRKLFECYRHNYRYPNKGDVLLSAAGTIGRTVIFDGEPAYFQDSNIVWLEHNEKIILNGYLYFLYNETKWNTEDTTISRLYNENFLSTLIAYPSSLSEQKRIAEVLSDIDVLIENLGKLIAKKQAIKQGAMQQLLTGKTRLAAFSEPWVEKRLGDCATMNSGGTPSTNDKSNYGGNIPFLSITDISIAGKYINSTEKQITEKGLNSSSARMFNVGTIMYAMYASVGKCAIANINLATSQAILGITTNPSLNSHFLYYYLTFIQEQIISQGQTGTQTNLNKGIVCDIQIMMPSDTSEQQAIATILSDMDSEIAALEAKKAKYEAIKQGAMQQLLTGKIRLV